jgi:flagellar protein FlaG
MKEVNLTNSLVNMEQAKTSLNIDAPDKADRTLENRTELEAVEKIDEIPDQDELLVEDVKNNLEKLNQFIPVTSTNLSFEFDDTGGTPFIRVIDKDNDAVIREIPSKEFREVAKALDEFADKLSSKGFIFDKTV